MAHYYVQKSRSISFGEKRRGELPVPLNLRSLLSEQQLSSVRQMECFGWRLAFVRRADNQIPMVVIANKNEKKFALLEKDGSINTSCRLDIRH